MIRSKVISINQIDIDRTTALPGITAKECNIMKVHYSTLDESTVFPEKAQAAFYEHKLNGGNARLRDIERIFSLSITPGS